MYIVGLSQEISSLGIVVRKGPIPYIPFLPSSLNVLYQHFCSFIFHNINLETATLSGLVPVI